MRRHLSKLPTSLAMIAICVSLSSLKAHSFSIFQRTPTDPILQRDYPWWLQAYEILSQNPTCEAAQAEFQRLELDPPPFCDPNEALQGLVALERQRFPKETPDGKISRPAPDFDRKLRTLETRIKPGLFQKRALDGYFSLTADLTCRRCSSDDSCDQSDHEWRSALSRQPYLLSLHLSEKQSSCENAAQLAAHQYRTLKEGDYPEEVYDFRFARCLTDFPVCRTPVISSSGYQTSFHMSCIDGVQTPIVQEFREKMLQAVVSHAQRIVQGCEGLPLSRAEVEGSKEGAFDPLFDLITCFPGQKSAASPHRAGLLQFSPEDFDWNRLPFQNYTWTEVREETDPNSGFLGFGQDTRKVARTQHSSDPQDSLRPGATVTGRHYSALNQIPENGRIAIKKAVEILLEDRIRFSPSLLKKWRRAQRSHRHDLLLPEVEVDRLKTEWTAECIRQDNKRAQRRLTSKTTVDDT
jgi:hypothetical protein